jgi:hypothetical protein
MLEQLKNKLKIKKMTEKIILKETITKGKPEVESKPKKKYYKPRKKREILEIDIPKIGLNNFHKIVHTEKPYLEYKKLITNKNVGSYFMGTGKGFHIHLEKKPNWLHRKCMKLFLGWEWVDSKSK